MLELSNEINTWDHPDFKATLKQSLETLDPNLLPLQQGLSHSSYVGATPHQVVILTSTDTAAQIEIKCGIFYGGIIAGCQCADDPTPPDECQEYCEVMVRIEKSSGRAEISLLEN